MKHSLSRHSSDLQEAIAPPMLTVSPEMPLVDVLSLLHQIENKGICCSTAAGSLRDPLIQRVGADCIVVAGPQLLGVLTRRDVLGFALGTTADRDSADATGISPLNRCLADLMPQSAIALKATDFDRAATALLKMRQHQIRYLPILDGYDRPMGVVTPESLLPLLNVADLLALQSVTDGMIEAPVSAPVDVSAHDVARLMLARGVSQVIITAAPVDAPYLPESGSSGLGRPVGCVSETDVLNAQARGLDLKQLKAEEVMGQMLVCISADKSLKIADQQMQRHAVDWLAVTDSRGLLQGIVTRQTLLAAIEPDLLAWIGQAKSSLSQGVAALAPLSIAAGGGLLPAASPANWLGIVPTADSLPRLLPDLLQPAVAEVRQRLQANRAIICQLPLSGQDNLWAEAGCSGDLGQIDSTRLPLPAEWLADVTQTRCLPDLQSASSAGDHQEAELAQLGVTALIMVPIWVEHQPWGLLIVHYCQQPHWWQPEELEWLEQTAKQLAIAIQHIQAYEQFQTYLAERQQMAESLQKTEATNRALLESVPDLMIRMSRDGTYLDFIPTEDFQIIMPAEWVQGKTIYDVMPLAIAEQRMYYVEQALQTGKTQIYEFDLEINGQIQHQEARVAVSGPDEVLVIIRDISVRKQTQIALQSLVAGVAGAIGDAFFPELVRHVAAALSARYVMVTQVMGDRQDWLETLAFWNGDRLDANFAYPLKGSPCQHVLQQIGHYCYHARDVQTLFPDDQALVDLGVESYLGIPLFNAVGQPIGHICAMHDQPTQMGDWMYSILSIFAVRAAAEIERQQAERAISKREAQFRTLVANIPGVVYRCQHAQEWQGMYISDEIVEIVGVAAADFGQDGDRTFASMVHAQDMSRIDDLVERAIAQRQPFDLEYRLVHADGSIRWVQDKGQPIFDDQAQLLWIDGVLFDITDHKQAEVALQNLIAGTAAVTGADFFPALVSHLASALDVRHALVAEIASDQLQTLAFYSDGQLQANLEYNITTQPCSLVITSGNYCCAADARQQFPQNPYFHILQAESYMGVALNTESGQPIGHLCIVDDQPIRDPDRADAIMRAFASRAAAELERQRASRGLQRLNQELEQRVEQRTADLQESQERLRQSEELLRLTIENAPIGITTMSLAGQFLTVNRAFCDIMGYSVEDLLQRTCLDVTAPADGAESQAQTVRLLRDEVSQVQMEKRYIHQDGSVIDTIVRLALVRNEAGEPIQFVAEVEDVRERKRADAALRHSEDRFRTLLINTPGAVYRCAYDADWTMEFISEAIVDICGFPAADFIHNRLRSAASIVHPDDGALNQQQVEEALAMRQPYVLEYRMLHADGSIRWVYEKGQGFFADNGQVLHLDGVMFDITARKQAENDLAKRDRYLTALVELQRRLLEIPADHHLYDNILSVLGPVAGASRIYIFENHWGDAGDLLSSQRAEWCAPGITPQIDNPTLQNAPYGRSLQRWAEQLSQGHIIQGLVAEMPESERAVLASQDILSILVLPLMVHGNFFGYVGFDNCTTARPWEPLEVSLLTSAAAAIALAKEHQVTQASLKQQLAAVEAASDGIAILNPKHEYVYVNTARLCLFGYDHPAALLGHSWWELYEPQAAQQFECDVLPALQRDRQWRGEVVGRRQDGSTFPEEVSLTAIEGGGLVCVSQDISARKQAEEQMKTSLYEKELLLKEVHHRVKNNLQVISSLFSLQSQYIQDEHILSILTDSQNRISTMALIHEKLYESSSLASIDFTDYIQDLIVNLFDSYNISRSLIRLHLNIAEIRLNLDAAIPCGLLVNELVSNSLKHAFPSGQQGDIHVEFVTTSQGSLRLMVQDNGRGLPAGVNLQDSNSLGLRLVRALTRQLRGQLEVHSDQGTLLQIIFPPPRDHRQF